MTNTDSMGDNNPICCGFCRAVLPPDAVYCSGCGACKLKTSYKVEKFIVATLFALLLPIGLVAGGLIWMYDWPLPLYIAVATAILIGGYFSFAARRILKQWNFWHR